MQLFSDDDDYMMTTPRENFFQIMYTANRNIVEMELEKVFERLAVAERMLEERELEEEHERLLQTLPVTDPEDVENRKNSLFIETVGAIVSQCE